MLSTPQATRPSSLRASALPALPKSTSSIRSTRFTVSDCRYKMNTQHHFCRHRRKEISHHKIASYYTECTLPCRTRRARTNDRQHRPNEVPTMLAPTPNTVCSHCHTHMALASRYTKRCSNCGATTEAETPAVNNRRMANLTYTCGNCHLNQPFYGGKMRCSKCQTPIVPNAMPHTTHRHQPVH